MKAATQGKPVGISPIRVRRRRERRRAFAAGDPGSRHRVNTVRVDRQFHRPAAVAAAGTTAGHPAGRD